MALQKRQHFLLLQRCIKKIEPPTVAGNRGQFKFSSFKDFLYCFLCYISLRVIFSYFGKMLDVNRYFISQNVRPTLKNVRPTPYIFIDYKILQHISKICFLPQSSMRFILQSCNKDFSLIPITSQKSLFKLVVM